METFAGSLFSACLTGLLVWWMMCRDARRIATPTPPTVEIERLRAVVDELTGALEQSAETARQKLADTICEAHTAVGLLDGTLTAAARADKPVESRGLSTAPESLGAAGTPTREVSGTLTSESERPAALPHSGAELAPAAAEVAKESHAEPDFAVPAPAPADRAASPPDDRYSAIYALVASGVTNAVEIARRTGLGRGEVELHMGLHARNVL